jgi:hypothetical protein
MIFQIDTDTMSQVLNSLLSSIDPSAVPKTPPPDGRQPPAASASRPLPRVAADANGAPQSQTLKRKADGPTEGGYVKIQRKEGSAPPARPVGTVRPAPTGDTARSKSATPANSIPYRGTAGTGGATTPKPSDAAANKPTPMNNTSIPAAKAAVQAPKSSGVAPTPKAAPATAKKGSYAAMLQRAKEVQQAKPAAPPIKHEPTKILTKKEREALRSGSASAAKGKKSAVISSPVPSGQGKPGDAKEKRKPTELGYAGTARPPKKPAEIAYKGTARPSSATPQPSGKTGTSTSAKPKSRTERRYDGYADWSDLDDMEDEEDYDSDGSSDMEGGMWDVEKEEALAMKIAKEEDLKALEEEAEHKRQKEERKRKLMAMNKAAAGKRKY